MDPRLKNPPKMGRRSSSPSSRSRSPSRTFSDGGTVVTGESMDLVLDDEFEEDDAPTPDSGGEEQPLPSFINRLVASWPVKHTSSSDGAEGEEPGSEEAPAGLEPDGSDDPLRIITHFTDSGPCSPQDSHLLSTHDPQPLNFSADQSLSPLTPQPLSSPAHPHLSTSPHRLLSPQATSPTLSPTPSPNVGRLAPQPLSPLTPKTFRSPDPHVLISSAPRLLSSSAPQHFNPQDPLPQISNSPSPQGSFTTSDPHTPASHLSPSAPKRLSPLAPNPATSSAMEVKGDELVSGKLVNHLAASDNSELGHQRVPEKVRPTDIDLEIHLAEQDAPNTKNGVSTEEVSSKLREGNGAKSNLQKKIPPGIDLETLGSNSRRDSASEMAGSGNHRISTDQQSSRGSRGSISSQGGSRPGTAGNSPLGQSLTRFSSRKRARSSLRAKSITNAAWSKIKSAVKTKGKDVFGSAASFREAASIRSTKTLSDAEIQTTNQEAMPLLHSEPIGDLLRDICTVTGFAHGEVWVRPVKEKHDEGHNHTPTHPSRGSTPWKRGSGSSTVSISQANAAFRNSQSSMVSENSGEGGSASRLPTGPGRKSPESSKSPPMSRRSRRKSFADNFLHRPSGGSSTVRAEARVSSNNHGSFADHGEHVDKLKSSLKFSGHVYTKEDNFEDYSVHVEHMDNFKTTAFRISYEKGEGIPGAAWSRKDLDWTDLSSMSYDDERASDQRVAWAKRMFDLSVGIPILDPSGRCIAVMVMYHAGKKVQGRMQGALAKEFHRNEVLVRVLEQAATLASTALSMQEAKDKWKTALEEMTAEDEELLRRVRSNLEVPGDSYTLVQDDDNQSLVARIKRKSWIYFKKYLGQRAQPPGRHGPGYCLMALIGTFLSLLLISGIDETITGIKYEEDTLFALIASFGAVTSMAFGAPTSFFVQPRNIIGGHVIATVVALSMDYLVNDDYYPVIPEWLAAAIAPALATAIMTGTALLHPPAAACAVIYITGDSQVKNLGWMFFALPVMADCVLCIVLSVVINNLSNSRRYPLYW